MSNLEPVGGGKPAVQSTTIWGAVAALLGVVAPPILAHFNVTAADAQQVAQIVGDIIAAVGSLVAIYGRASANVPLPPITSVIKPKE
jgi:hypothetical protein